MNSSIIQVCMQRFAALAVLATLAVISPATSGAAPVQQGTGVEEGKCELVSVGNYYCKVNGKCYYCTKKDNPNPSTDCYKETTCDKAASRPRPGPSAPLTPGGAIQRRGVEGEQPDSGSANPSGTSPETK